jgi:ABC-type spermidine/putrescine transport system permease subunit I
MRRFVIVITALAVGLAVAFMLSLAVTGLVDFYDHSRDYLTSNVQELMLKDQIWTLLGRSLACAIGATVASAIVARLAAHAIVLEYLVVSVILLLGSAWIVFQTSP